MRDLVQITHADILYFVSTTYDLIPPSTAYLQYSILFSAPCLSVSLPLSLPGSGKLPSAVCETPQTLVNLLCNQRSQEVKPKSNFPIE